MEHLHLIHLYGQGTNDFDTSPFESLEMLHTRSELHHAFLSKEEKRMLAAYDVKLLGNIEKMVEHIGKVYDFSNSKEPNDEWWWHLDKLLTGEIMLHAHSTQNNVG